MSGVIWTRRHKPVQCGSRLAEKLKKYNAKILAVPSASINLADNTSLAFVSGALIRSGNFSTGATNSYIDLGSTAHIGANDYSFVLVSKMRSFLGTYTTPVGIKSTTGNNPIVFYSNDTRYDDITIGIGTSTGTAYPLTQFGNVRNTWHNLVFTKTSAGGKLFCNGQELVASGTNTTGLISGNTVIGQNSHSNLSQPFDGDVALFALFNGVLPDQIALELSEDPRLVFEPSPRRIWAVTTTTEVTGTVSYTNANDTASASGTTTVTGSSATTNANDTSAASGAVGSDVTGSVAYTNLSDTSSAAGTTTVTGSSATTNANDTVTASGFAGSVTGTVNYQNSGDTVAASGSGGAVVAEFSGGYPYVSREDHAERRKKERVKLGIVKEDGPTLKSSNNKDLTPKKRVLVPASEEKNLLAEQEAFNAELRHLLQLEFEREEEAIVRMLMEL